MANRISALQGHLQTGRFGTSKSVGTKLELLESLQLGQIAAWPNTLDEVGTAAVKLLGQKTVPKPMKSTGNAQAALLRVEPLKWWLLGIDLPELSADQGACLDLSHSRTRIRISGENAVDLLNRLIPLNLSESAFPLGHVASSAIHHVGVTLWRNERGYELFIPRGFAVSIWETLLKTALQFGVEVSVS